MEKRGACPSSEELARRGVGREGFRVAFGPAGEEGVGVVLRDEGPDAAAKAPSESRCRGRSEVTRLLCQPDRFRDLVAEKTLRQILGLVDEEAEGGGVAARESVAGGRDDPGRLLQKLLEAADEIRRSEGRIARAAEDPPDLSRRPRRGGGGCEQRRVGAPGLEAPEIEDCRGRERQAVVLVSRAAGLFGGDAARCDGEGEAFGAGKEALVMDGTEAVLRERAGSAAEDRRVVLASSERADAAVSGQAPKRLSVLEASEVAAEVFFVFDRGVVLGAFARDS